MTERLWSETARPDPRVERVTVGDDPRLDVDLVAFDALGSVAHAVMLSEIGLLTQDECQQLRTGLWRIAEDAKAGTFTIDVAQEDCHTAIEQRLTAEFGDAGRRIHTGRSRNDQVLAALRLWAREQLIELGERVLELVEALRARADEFGDVSLPGYTHTRQAMPATLGFYLAAHAESLLDDLRWLETAFRHVNRSPLGSAAGFGVAIPLDRARVAELLGFDGFQNNTLAVQNDRGKTEALILAVVATTATDLGRLASDLIWFSSDELGYVKLSPSVTTGSSIMPQKRNPDVLEIVRASAARLRSLQHGVADIYGSLPSGYHRDLQLTKRPLLEGVQSLSGLLGAMTAVVESCEADRERARAAIRPETAATDALYADVREGVPFRTAYRRVAEAPGEAYHGDVPESWRERGHAGSPSQPNLNVIAERALQEAKVLGERKARLAAVWNWFEEVATGTTW